VFYEKTKHIKTDCHFIREKLLSTEINTEFINSSNQHANILTNHEMTSSSVYNVPCLIHTIYLLQLEGEGLVMIMFCCIVSIKLFSYP